MLAIKWTDPQIIGAVVAAIIGLLGVLLTIYFNKNSSDGNNHQQKQSSTFSWRSKQFQAGRDINLKEQADNEEKMRK